MPKLGNYHHGRSYSTYEISQTYVVGVTVSKEVTVAGM